MLVTAKPWRRSCCAKAAAVGASSAVKLSATRRCWSSGGVGRDAAAVAGFGAAAFGGSALGAAAGCGTVSAFAVAGRDRGRESADSMGGGGASARVVVSGAAGRGADGREIVTGGGEGSGREAGSARGTLATVGSAEGWWPITAVDAGRGCGTAAGWGDARGCDTGSGDTGPTTTTACARRLAGPALSRATSRPDKPGLVTAGEPSR